MSNAVHPEVTQGVLDLAMSLMEEEHEKLLCIALSLANKLEPKNPKDIQDDEDVIAWRLAQVLEERLSSVEFLNDMRGLLKVAIP